MSVLWLWDLYHALRFPLTNFSSDMAGFCPNGGPPDCIPGQKWSPNDPLFFLHHGVRGPSHPSLALFTRSLQMIDKIWHDWQKKSPMNKYSYGGGSVVPYSNFTTFLNFPTGLPPYLNVSARSVCKPTRALMTSDVIAFPPPA